MSERERDDAPLSAGAKVGAAIVGFVAFYALALLVSALGAILSGFHSSGAAVSAGLAVVLAVVYWMVRARRLRTGQARRKLSWIALGFAAAMVVFGGCLVLVGSG